MSKRKTPDEDFSDFSDADLPYIPYVEPAAAAAAKPPPSQDKEFSKRLRFGPLPVVDTTNLYSENITAANKEYLNDKFGVLYQKWGYRQGFEGKHTKYEAGLHLGSNIQCYASCYPITDKLFRNLQQLCDGWPTLHQTDLTSNGAKLNKLCDIGTVKQLMSNYLKEDDVEDAMLSLANYSFVSGESNQGIMATLCAAARGFLFLTAGKFGEFNAEAATVRPRSANECLAYINALARFKPPKKRRAAGGAGTAGGRAGGRKRSQSRSSVKKRRSVRSGSRRSCKK